jgi:hypothetical protein
MVVKGQMEVVRDVVEGELKPQNTYRWTWLKTITITEQTSSYMDGRQKSVGIEDRQ